MNDKEAIEYGKKWDAAIESRGDTPFSEARQFLNLAIKAIHIVDIIKEELGPEYEENAIWFDVPHFEEIQERAEKRAEIRDKREKEDD